MDAFSFLTSQALDTSCKLYEIIKQCGQPHAKSECKELQKAFDYYNQKREIIYELLEILDKSETKIS